MASIWHFVTPEGMIGFGILLGSVCLQVAPLGQALSALRQLNLLPASAETALCYSVR